jgi:hypothetical protein
MNENRLQRKLENTLNFIIVKIEYVTTCRKQLRQGLEENL